MCLNDQFVKYAKVDLPEIQPTSDLTLLIANDKFFKWKTVYEEVISPKYGRCYTSKDSGQICNIEIALVWLFYSMYLLFYDLQFYKWEKVKRSTD